MQRLHHLRGQRTVQQNQHAIKLLFRILPKMKKEKVYQETRKELDDLKQEIIIRDMENELDEVYRQNVRIKKEKAELQRDIDRKDSMITKFYDLLRNDEIPNSQKLEIIKIIIDAECDLPLNLTEDIVYEMFRAGLFR